MVDMAKIVLTSDTRDLKKGERDMNSFAKKGEQTERSVKKSSTGIVNSLKSIGIAAAAVAVISVFKVAAGFQDLRTSLHAVTGSAEGAADAFELINSVVGETPFTVSQLAQSFIKLKSAGLEPTTDQMMMFSDVASITTDRLGTLQAITDLYARTTAGGLGLEDLNRLADRGVPVFKILQERLGLARLEIAKVGQSAKGAAMLLAALEDGFRDVAGGASELASKNLSVAMSNLMDAIRSTADAVANFTGATSGLAGVIQGAAMAIQDFNAGFKDITTAIKTAWAESVTFKASVIAIAGAIGASLIPAVLSLGAALTALALSNPFTAILLGVALAAAAIVTFVGKVGGVGVAFDLLKDVAVEVWDRITLKVEIFSLRFNKMIVDMEIEWAKAMQRMATTFFEWTDNIAPIMAEINRMGGGDGGIWASGAAERTKKESDAIIKTLIAISDSYTSEIVGLVKETKEPLKALEALAEAVADVADETDAATVALGKTKKAVETLADKMKTELISAIDGVSHAFADWIGRGLRDFKSFAGSILSTFKQMLINMIALAAKNRIMISLGLGGAGVGGAASAATGATGGGMLGTLVGGFGAAGAAGTGLLGGLGAVGSGLMAGGIGGAAAATGTAVSAGVAAGGLAGTGMALGAIAPWLLVGFALFSIFKKKPPYREKDFNAIQAAIELTNVELLNTGTAGQRAATALKKAFGGLENLQKATASYYNNFFSNEEKRQRAIEGIDAVFAQLGITVPETKSAFRDIVEAQDLMTSGGRNTYAALLQVSEAFAQVYGGVNDVTDALMALNASVGGSIFSTLVDERRAAAYQRNGIAFDVDQPERAGGGIAFRGTGPRITTTAQAEADKLAESLAAQAETQTALLIDIQKSTTRSLRINDSWDVVGLPPERT